MQKAHRLSLSIEVLFHGCHEAHGIVRNFSVSALGCFCLQRRNCTRWVDIPFALGHSHKLLNGLVKICHAACCFAGFFVLQYGVEAIGDSLKSTRSRSSERITEHECTQHISDIAAAHLGVHLGLLLFEDQLRVNQLHYLIHSALLHVLACSVVQHVDLHPNEGCTLAQYKSHSHLILHLLSNNQRIQKKGIRRTLLSGAALKQPRQRR
jgi:hypothetical protein